MVVETAQGKVEGAVQDGVRVFLGIPYARPPVGSLRLRPPQPMPPWAGVRPALAEEEGGVAGNLGLLDQIAALPRPPLEAVADGLSADVSILLGTHLEEWKIFGLGDPGLKTLDHDGLLERVERVVPGSDDTGVRHAERAVATYRSAREGRHPIEPSELFAAIEGDRLFRVPAVRLAEAARGRAPHVYKYLFTWRSPALGGLLGSCHALEIPFVFGTTDVPALRGFVGEGEGGAGCPAA